MGSVNYNTSDYITLSIKPYDFDDIKAGIIEDIKNGDFETQEVTDNLVYDYISDCYSCDHDNAAAIIKKYNLNYYHVSIKPGYYEGLSIDIENNFGDAYDDYIEKKEAQKDITRLKALLIELAGCGFVSTVPGWVTTYKDYKQTLQDIRAAVTDIRKEARHIPTWRDYNANRHYKYM